MASKFISYQNGIFVEESPKKCLERNGYYQSDFKIIQGKDEFKVTIFTNQPLYYYDGEFHLVPEEIRELMCYSPFSVKEIICYGIRDSGLSREIMNMLKL